MSLFSQQIEAVQGAIVAAGGEIDDLYIDPPAPENEIAAMERRLRIKFPPSLRRFFAEESKNCGLLWSLEGSSESPFPRIYSGGIELSLHGIRHMEEARVRWIEASFPDLEDPYHAVWHHKLPIICAPNGDQIAFDLNPESYEQIVYLSHDGGEGHGYVMADDLDDLIERWLPLGCPGPEDWQWIDFTESSVSGLQPDGKNGLRWRTFMGLLSDPAAQPGEGA